MDNLKNPFNDKRYYSRYKVLLPGRVGDGKGIIVDAEIIDISIGGARIKIDQIIPISVGELIYLLIKWKRSIKVKGIVKWINKKGNFLEFGIQFVEVPMDTVQDLSDLVSEYALSKLTDEYAK